MSVTETDVQEADDTMGGEIIPPQLAVKAMRDSGYKNTAYALAELVDNSIQADAELVEVFCIEDRELVNQRERRRIQEIAVLDNGKGMQADVLEMALQFGNGTHLGDRSGIGRFGMGLPNASISQCRMVEVWSWQNGPDNALYSFLNLDEIEQGRTRKVPPPVHEPLPQRWRDMSEGLRETGTLVRWSRFDEHRLTWRTARPTLEHTETIAGRMYRKMIAQGSVAIRLVVVEQGNLDARYARVNDPLYLLSPSSTPAPFDNEPMFQKWGEHDQSFEIEVGEKKHTVVVRISWARQETVPQDGVERGKKAYGKHAAGNVGVSIVRADRELELDPSWANVYEPTERWWGVEVDFPPALDDIFGVTNNKQHAMTFSGMAQFDWEAEREGNESFTDFKRRLAEEGDSRVFLLDIALYIREQLGQVRKRLGDQTKGTRTGQTRHGQPSVDDRASTKFKERAQQGHRTDQDGQSINDDNEGAVVDDLVNKGYSEPAAQEMVKIARLRGRNVMFVEADVDSNALFNVESKPGVTEIVLNTSHPAFKQLVQVLDSDVTDSTDRDLVGRIQNASDTLRMLLAAWGRYEMEDVPNRSRIRDVRHEWGKMARDFLTDEAE
jgi:hypothetical protein